MKWILLVLRVILGAIFIFAALPKIQDPPSFAHLVYNYKLLPLTMINMVALVLPWLELICGVFLIFGIWKQTVSSVVAGLLLIFILGLAINLAHGNAIQCGCFGNAATKTSTELFHDMKLDLLRDAALLTIAVVITVFSRPRTFDTPQS